MGRRNQNPAPAGRKTPRFQRSQNQMIEEYFESVKTFLQSLSLSQPPEVEYDYRDRETGFLKGDLVFKDGSCLHFHEFVQVKQKEPVYRYMYAFQYMKADGTLIFRYDDTGHFPHLPS